MKRCVVLVIMAGLAAFVMTPAVVSAKTPGYVLTGGDLGDYAVSFYTDDYVEHPNAGAVEIPKPAIGMEKPYQLYSTWPLETAEQVVSGRPQAVLYAESHVVHNPGTDQWFRISDGLWFGQESWSGVQKAIDKARLAVNRGETEGPILAALDSRFGDGTFIVTGNTSPAFRVATSDFPLPEFAKVLANAPLPAPLTDAPREWLKVYGSAPNVSPILLMYYAPPQAGMPGEIEAPNADDKRRWLAGAEFDDAFSAATKLPLILNQVERWTFPGEGIAQQVASPESAVPASRRASSKGGAGGGWGAEALAAVTIGSIASAALLMALHKSRRAGWPIRR